MKKLLAVIFLSSILFTGCQSDTVTEISVTTLVKSTESWNGAPLPHYPEGQPEVTILKIIIPPKARLPMHKHPKVNAGVVLKGELTVVSEASDTLWLKAGEPIVELVDAWHYGFNEGPEPIEIIVFYAGIEGEPITLLNPDIMPFS